MYSPNAYCTIDLSGIAVLGGCNSKSVQHNYEADTKAHIWVCRLWTFNKMKFEHYVGFSQIWSQKSKTLISIYVH